MKTEWGFTKLLSHDVLKDPLNGYLVNDCCIFGVEVFVVKSSLSLVEETDNALYTWKISNYSALDKYCHCSDVFTVEGRKWKLALYPKGDSKTIGEHLSLFLRLHDSETLEPGQKLHAEFVLRIKDHTDYRKHHEEIFNYWFDAPGYGWDWPQFMLLRNLRDPSNGYLANDSMTVAAKFDLISAVKDFS